MKHKQNAQNMKIAKPAQLSGGKLIVAKIAS